MPVRLEREQEHHEGAERWLSCAPCGERAEAICGKAHASFRCEQLENKRLVPALPGYYVLLVFCEWWRQDIVMSDNDNVESHTIRLLQEMRGEMAEFRQEFTGFKQEMTGFKAEMIEFRQETERRFNVLEPAVVNLVGAVTAIAKTQEQHTALLLAHNEKLVEIQRTQNVMEKDMRGIRGRVERIEDHIGLVKA